MTKHPEALKAWHEKLDFLLREVALEADHRRRFQLEKDIIEAQEKIAELEPNASKSSLRVIAKDTTPSRTSAPFPGRLPIAATSFIGREREIQELSELLSRSRHSLVNIIGPPGTGKTRLAIEVARNMKSLDPRNVYFVDLSEARDSEDITLAVAQSLGVPLVAEEGGVETVARVMECRGCLFLILDNFEQIVDSAQGTVAFWRQRAPQIQFLITSRSSLRLYGEILYDLSPFSLPVIPDTVGVAEEELELNHGVRLFLERTRLRRRNFKANAKELVVIAGICRQLDGIPLAIELAASRTSVLSPDQILARIGQTIPGLEVLTAERSDQARRHRTLLTAIDWSYQILDEQEKLLFLKISIFRGGFFLEAAEEIFKPESDLREASVLDRLQSLVEKSLITAEETSYGMRFRMLRPLWEYCRSRYQAISELDRYSLRRRFAAYYLSYARKWRERARSSGALDALNRLELELPNFFEIHRWALSTSLSPLSARILLLISEALLIRGPIEQGISRIRASLVGLKDREIVTIQLRLRIALSDLLFSIGQWDLASSVAQEVLKSAEAVRSRLLYAEAALRVGYLKLLRNQEVDGAIRLLQDAAGIYGERGDRRGECRALVRIARCQMFSYKFQEALDLCEKAHAASQQIDDPLLVRDIQTHRGLAHRGRKELSKALECFVLAERIDGEMGYKRMMAVSLNNQGLVLRLLGRCQDAIRCIDHAEKINRHYGNLHSLAAGLHNRGLCYRDLGRHRAAIEQFQMAEELNRRIGNSRWLWRNINGRGLALMDCGLLDESLCCFLELRPGSESLSEQDYAYGIGNRGRVLIRQGKIAEGLQCIDEAEEINRKLENMAEIAENKGNRGQALFDQGKYSEAAISLRESLKLFELYAPLNRYYRFGFVCTLAEVEYAMGNNIESSALVSEALDLAQEVNLTEQSEPRWYLDQLRGLMRLREELSSLVQPDL